MGLVIGEQIHTDEFSQINGLQNQARELIVVFDQFGQELHDVWNQSFVVFTVENHASEHLIDYVEVLRADQVRSIQRRDLSCLSYNSDHGNSFETPYTTLCRGVFDNRDWEPFQTLQGDALIT